MPIKIHHGPPGSYKTAGAVADDFLREAKAGRTIITNIRGLTYDRVIDEFPDLPETFNIIHVDHQTTEGRLKLAKWFHWAPPGAFLLIDEAQMIWPKSWRENDLNVLAYPGGPDQAAADGRPKDWATAWEMHRHWNWDVVLTTPNIKKIRDDIRQTAEAAYKHKNLGMIGIRGRYIEGFHMADDDGGHSSQFLSTNMKKVPPYVWKLYDSTATGQITDTKAGLSLFKNPRIVILLGVLALATAFIFRNGAPKNPLDSGSAMRQMAPAGSAPPGQAAGVHPPTSGAGTAHHVSGGNQSKSLDDVEHPFKGPLYIAAGFETKGKYRFIYTLNGVEITDADMKSAGYYVRPLNYCLVQISYQGATQFVRCIPPTGEGEGRGGTTRTPPAPAARHT